MGIHADKVLGRKHNVQGSIVLSFEDSFKGYVQTVYRMVMKQFHPEIGANGCPWTGVQLNRNIAIDASTDTHE